MIVKERRETGPLSAACAWLASIQVRTSRLLVVSRTRAASRLVCQSCSRSQAERSPISKMRRILNILAPALLWNDWSAFAFSPVPTPAPTVSCTPSQTQLSLVLTDSSGDGWEGATATLSTDPFANVTHSITLASGSRRTWDTCVQNGYYYLSISSGSSPADLG